MNGHDELCPYRDEVQERLKPNLCSNCALIMDVRLRVYNTGYKDGYNDALNSKV